MKSILKKHLVFLTFWVAVFIPSLVNPAGGSGIALAATPTPASSPSLSSGSAPSTSPSATPSQSPSSSPAPSGVPSPSASPSVGPGVWNPALYSIDAPNSLWVVVNKTRPLNPISYVPPNLVTPRFDDGAGSNPQGLQLAKPAAKAIKLMATAMKAAGIGTLLISSAYRSYTTQVAVHARDVAALGLAAGENLAARPGYSEHQTGLAADLAAVGQGCVIRVCFATTKAGKWLASNAWQYGFVLRYPDGQTPTTGYQFEPWHYRYVGLELSTHLHQVGATVLEKFWGLPASPKY